MSTIMETARRGEITPMMKKIAERENVSPEFIRNGIASGRICAPCNPAHDPEPAAIGEGLSVKINVNLGKVLPQVLPAPAARQAAAHPTAALTLVQETTTSRM